MFSIKHTLYSVVLMLASGIALAAPYVPASDTQVVERLPTRANDAASRELLTLRNAARQDPDDAEAAAALARHYFERAMAEGDPRYAGYAQAAINRWWGATDPPVAAQVMRAILLQFSHGFDEAVADLDAATRKQPDLAEAWAWLAAIHMVQADYPQARLACERLAPLAPPLIAVACQAYVDSVSGSAGPAAASLQAALKSNAKATPAQRLWALTRLAEIEERRGAFGPAEAAFKEALALGLPDVYLLAAYSDMLLDQGRATEVLALLKNRAKADVLLLRLALAAQASKDPALAGWTGELSARFAAAQARGDSAHEKEESRFALALLGQPERALALARDNYAKQRESADARILLEAALAAKNRDAAAPVLQWMATSRVESVALRALAAKVQALP